MFESYNWEHVYSFAATGMKLKSKYFVSRELAKQEMYKVMAKNHLAIRKVYDDKHFKTYICNNGVRFYINRAL